MVSRHSLGSTILNTCHTIHIYDAELKLGLTHNDDMCCPSLIKIPRL